ncbi:hypothetical protein ElyMa_001038200 [Elysia marginata]|uniref:Ig-like domain-containing protein n=1 Tax=Elysia marginata TaxID=1093978 RepID=A0AAV4HM04_9GAST|nr:hypothetical protein ElyMa_001038200 [Elysia marginata]
MSHKLYSIPVETACDPVEEGQSTTLTCDLSLAEDCPKLLVMWKASKLGYWYETAICYRTICGSHYSSHFPTNKNSTGSTLTISNASRIVPFDMETKWVCNQCSGGFVTVCDKLEIYARPASPECVVNESPGFVTVSCFTNQVYPEAKCSFYRQKNGGNHVKIAKSPDYSHKETAKDPVYYSSACLVTVPKKELGEGTHSFSGYIYPDVTGGENLVNGITLNKNVTLGSDSGSAQTESPPPPIEIFQDVDNNNINNSVKNNRVLVACRTSKQSFSKAPTFSFSLDGIAFDSPHLGSESRDGSYYQRLFSPSPDVDGQYHVICRVTNTVTNTWQDVSIHTHLTNNAQPKPKEDDKANESSGVIVGVVAALVVSALIVIIVLLVRENHNLRHKPSHAGGNQDDLYLTPIETSDIVKTLQTAATNPYVTHEYETYTTTRR